MNPRKKGPNEAKFEDIVGRLEDIVKKLEAGDDELDLEESLELFKEGIQLVKSGTVKLNEVEKQVDILMKEVENEDLPETEPFAGDDDSEVPF